MPSASSWSSAGLPREKLVTVHYGLDALPEAPSLPSPAELGLPPAAPLLLAVGRLIAQKDHATLLRAFARTRADHPDAVLAILGSGPLEDETRALVRRLGLDEAVLLPGRLEIRDWLERANVFVHTSRWEGFGIVLLEAMLAALPIVATRVSAVPEVVADGETGFLVDPGDDAGIGEAVNTLLSDPASRARAWATGARARQGAVLRAANGRPDGRRVRRRPVGRQGQARRVAVTTSVRVRKPPGHRPPAR